MKKSQHANNVVMKIHLTHASNNNSQGNYIQRVGQPCRLKRIQIISYCTKDCK